jgi:phosphohistidine phosphatase
MKLYLIQHAKAASKEDDPQRSLTDEGQRDIKKVAKFIKSLNLSIDYLWHSGKTRAQQTAEAIAEVIEIKKEMSAREDLAPNDNVEIIKDEITSANQDIMLVGHMPFVSRLASLLLTGSESSGTVVFQQGGIVCLNYSDENQWQFSWMIIPDLLI